MSNHFEFISFLQENRAKTLTGYPMASYRFDAMIRYTWKGKSGIFPAKVWAEADGWESGSITLTPQSTDISENDFHLRFSAKFQEFKFNREDNSLEIRGSSEKMGGAYTVEIHFP